MNLREQFEKSDLCKTMVGNHEEVNLRRYADTPKEPYRGQYMWSRLEAAWQGFQSGHAAGLEDAAKFLDEWNTAIGDDLAKSIRAMKEPK